MAVESKPGELGSTCSRFDLPATDGRRYSNESFKSSNALVVMFICNHCPYVQAVEERLLSLATSLSSKSVAFVGICSNDSENYPEDSFENMKERALSKKYPFPYLHDETQKVAKTFGAVCTPDIFVYDRDRKLAYRGRIDDSWKDASKVTREDLKDALLALVDGRTPQSPQLPTIGCSIKWKE